MKSRWLFLLFLPALLSAQRQWLQGRVLNDSIPLGGIIVINLVTEKEVATDKNGIFRIEATTDDMLVFPSDKFEYLRKTISADDLKSGSININLKQKPIALNEVVVNYISPNSIGLANKKPIATPAERRLATAGDFKPIMFLGLLGGSMPLDPVINAITGRTKQLKKQLEIEHKEVLITRLQSIFEDDFYKEKLHLPTEYITGFQYYAVEDKDFVIVLSGNNKNQIAFLLVGLADKYNELIALNK